MTIENTNSVDTGTTAVPTRSTAVAKKDAEVTCWNCLSSESYDRDVEPITLSKVRKQHREKLRLYSFVASQLSKPKAVPLKQRVSENYSVAKKLDERISQEQLSKNLTEDLNQELDSLEINDYINPKLEGNQGQKNIDSINENIFNDNINQRFQKLTAEVKKFPDLNASVEKLKIVVDGSTSIDATRQSFLNISAEFKDLSDFNRSHENHIVKAIHDGTFKTDAAQRDLTFSSDYNNSSELDTKSASEFKNDKKTSTNDFHRKDHTSTQKKLTKLDDTPEIFSRKPYYNTSYSDIDQNIDTSKEEQDLPKFHSLRKWDGTPENLLEKMEHSKSDIDENINPSRDDKVLPKFSNLQKWDGTTDKVLQNTEVINLKNDIDEKTYIARDDKDLREFGSLPKSQSTNEKIMQKTEYNTTNVNEKMYTSRHEKDLAKLDGLPKLHDSPEKILQKTKYITFNSDIDEKVRTSKDYEDFPKFDSTSEKAFIKTNDNNFGRETDQKSILLVKRALSYLDSNPENILRKEENITGDNNQRLQTISAEKMLPKFDNTYGKVLKNVDDTFSGNINENSQKPGVEHEKEPPELKVYPAKVTKNNDSNDSSNDGNNQRLQTSSHENKNSVKIDSAPDKTLKKIDNNDIKEHQAVLSNPRYEGINVPEVKVLNKVLVETITPKKKRGLAEFNTHKYSTLIEFKKKDDIIEELSDETDGAVTNSGRLSSTSDKIDNFSCSGSDSGYAESSIAATESKDSVRDLSSPEPTSLTSDKTDNASYSGSDCGYPESALNVAGSKDYVRNLSTPDSQKSESLNKSCLRQNFKSSLPSLATPQNISAKSTTSLYSPMSPMKKTSEKYIRWSTLSIHQKPITFCDETYVSDPISPGHATLPRRSNSPLPHERDLGDRYSLNRSGLQARSESMASVYSGAGEGMRGNVTVRGDVQFSLLYNYRLGALEVGVRRCRDLAPVDTKRNRSDPYVKVYLLPDKSKTGKRKTKVKKNTLNPVFEETLSFVQPLASLSARTLWLSVWHADMFGRNDFLGEVTLPLADVVFDDAAPMWYKLHERTEQFDEQQGTRGDLIIGLKFEMPETGPRAKGTLHVLVKEAKNVVATKPNGLADVFCKSYLLPERGRLAKQKTTVCRRTLSPRWEHTFTYRGLTMQELATRALELSLWDRDRLASNDFMGAVRLSLGTGTYMGANVNWMDSVGKEVTLWQTMMQRPNFWVEGSLPLRPQLNN